MTRASIAAVAAGAVAGLIVLGCKSSPPPTSPPDTGSEWQEAAVEDTVVEETVVDVEEIDLQTIYFDFDRYNIRSDAQPALRSNARGITSWDGMVTIEGHCDERGSEEYNLALGERRANAAKRYLVDLGVPSQKLRTVSFGEDRPAVQGHDESAWRYNRRADFVGN